MHSLLRCIGWPWPIMATDYCSTRSFRLSSKLALLHYRLSQVLLLFAFWLSWREAKPISAFAWPLIGQNELMQQVLSSIPLILSFKIGMYFDCAHSSVGIFRPRGDPCENSAGKSAAGSRNFDGLEAKWRGYFIHLSLDLLLLLSWFSSTAGCHDIIIPRCSKMNITHTHTYIHIYIYTHIHILSHIGAISMLSLPRSYYHSVASFCFLSPMTHGSPSPAQAEFASAWEHRQSAPQTILPR